MKVSLKVFVVSVFTVLILPAFVLAAPGIPSQFYGTVSFANGQAAPDGTIVEAKIDGQVVATCPVNGGQGKYGYNPILCFVTDPENNRKDKTINFFVSGLDTGKTATFINGASIKMNFSLSDVKTSITESANGVVSATTVTVVPETPTVIKMGDILNVSLTSSNSASAVVNEIKKLETNFFTGSAAILSGEDLLNGYEINITGDNINISVTMKYDDTGINEDAIKPYKFNGSSWVAISPFSQDKSANMITFNISSAHTPYVIFGEATSSSSSTNDGGGGGGGGGGGSTGDTTAPTISDIKVNTSRTAAVITWQTNEPSISWVSYGATAAYGKEIKTAAYITDHLIAIKDLSPGAIYHFQVKSKDSSGNIGSYTDKIFTTLIVQTKGDINDDGKVNKYDFALMMSDWGKTGLNIVSDLNNDGKVDKYDFSLLMINWSI